ncbi:MAG: Rrf2 family transcriptional regulator [Alphaproteobacteria bacterium]|nr:Rrf2 family transcriptional regulator [Alphaproteobacteria bacterium]MCB9792987.1 Rrf2 family transcriptional regulator [Alphaproteobacteria bacterium]
MQLSLRTDYALRTLLLLAAEPDRWIDAPEIAERYGISVHHVRKIIQDLARLEIVETRRGRDGGARLLAEPASLVLGALVRELEDLALLECFDAARNTCRLTPACALKGVLAEAQAAFLAKLDALTLADVVPSAKVTRALLRRPKAG